jgi:predicted Ser/Thr protein kinase
MNTVSKAMEILNRRMADRSRTPPIPFEEFLALVSKYPTFTLRNVFQVLRDMMTMYLGTGVDEYPNDPESIHYLQYDCSKLFEEGTERPFFADRLFANRLVNLIEAMSRGTQQNKIYIFNGPPGCGKSTFLNNLLKKFELFANSKDGMRYEIIWRLNPEILGFNNKNDDSSSIDKLASMLGIDSGKLRTIIQDKNAPQNTKDIIEIPCPSHDHPILLIPRNFRLTMLEELFSTSKFAKKLFSEKEYSWIFKDKPCTFCSSMYRTLLNTVKSAEEVHKMVFARQYHFNRRLGEGISVFNPGDPAPESMIVRNELIQRDLNLLFKNDLDVRYMYSKYAKTNNGIYALMDIKTHNTQRLIELHNIISEGVHKVDDIEENVNSLLLAVMNPEDQVNIKDFHSFTDRIEYINIPYVLDLHTERKIYTLTFGKQIETSFLPRVLENFARAIISTRMNIKSDAMLEWIGSSYKYHLFCDENLQLLKMAIYNGIIPDWLDEEDRKKLTAQRRKSIIAESEKEGTHGISGRDAIKVFNEFYSSYVKPDKLINMSMLIDFFKNVKKDLNQAVPAGFLDSLIRMYNYTVLQEVKESLYYYNERQISHDILNYLFAINFEPGTIEKCTFTNETIVINDAFFERIEKSLLGVLSMPYERKIFRDETQKEYTTNTLTQELMVDHKPILQTVIYKRLKNKYIQNLKQKVLDPFLDNDNFRRAIKDYNTKEFKTYDKKIREDVKYLLKNLRKKYEYSEQGAQEVCIYVIDNNLAQQFAI